jgi:hypothetical protein
MGAPFQGNSMLANIMPQGKTFHIRNLVNKPIDAHRGGGGGRGGEGRVNKGPPRQISRLVDKNAKKKKNRRTEFWQKN